MLYKICPVCGEQNNIDEFICKKCMSDISNAPIEEIGEKENVLILKNDETTLKIKPNDVVGRNYKGAEYLIKYSTVSRKHCQFFYENGKWYIQDLNSTNKTYLNGKAIESSKKIEIKNNDELSLSRSLKFKTEV